MIDLPALLQVVNVLIIPALVYVVRIDRRMGQLDTISAIDSARIARLESKYENTNQRLTTLEAKTL